MCHHMPHWLVHPGSAGSPAQLGHFLQPLPHSGYPSVYASITVKNMHILILVPSLLLLISSSLARVKNKNPILNAECRILC